MLAELRHLWPSLPTGAALQPILGYDVLPAIVSQYGNAAATLAADWYDAERSRLGVPGTFTADLAPEPPEDLVRAVSNWATSPEADAPTVQARTEGAAQKIVADMQRQTVAQSAERDPNARGWARFTDEDACGFCLMLAGRGGVYTSSTVKFGSHDHCHCLAGPVWDANYRETVDLYKRSPNVTDAQRRGARRWIRDNNLPG